MYVVLETYHKGLVKNEVIYGEKEEVISFFEEEKKRDWGIDSTKEFEEQIDMKGEVERLKKLKFLSNRKFLPVKM